MESLKQRLKIRAAKPKLNRIANLLNPEWGILDIGCGNGALSKLLSASGYQVSPLDVQNKSIFPSINPTLYDGEQMPYEDKTFDCALLITVLHHTPNPEEVIKEAKRVAKRVLIIEDTFSNALQEKITYFADSLVNMEFVGHPHTNKTDQGWKERFDSMGMSLDTSETWSFLLLFRQSLYFLIDTSQPVENQHL